jgi:hypothetical protein
MAGATRTHRPTGRRPTGRRPAGRYARASSHRSQGLHRRRQSKPSGVKGMLSGLRPGAAAKKAAPSSKKGAAGGLALVAAAAGMAFKNRQKLSAMRRKDAPPQPGAPTP